MFEVGQKVWDVVRGEGTVARINNDLDYPVVVYLDSGKSESYSKDGKYASYDENISLYPHPVEVIKKVSKPSINWGHVRKDFKFLAQDIDGNAYLYWEKPVLGSCDGWQSTRGDFAEAGSYVSYTPGTCDWKDSLIARPEGV